MLFPIHRIADINGYPVLVLKKMFKNCNYRFFQFYVLKRWRFRFGYKIDIHLFLKS